MVNKLNKFIYKNNKKILHKLFHKYKICLMIALDFKTFQLQDTLKEAIPADEKVKKLTKILFQLHTNYEILKHFNNTLDLEDFIMDTLITVNKLLGIDQLLLFLKNHDSLKLISMVSEHAITTDITIDRNSNPIIWDILDKQNACVINNINGMRKKFYGSSLKIDKNIKSILALPLFDRYKNPIGMLSAHSKNKNNFNESSIPFYTELAFETSKTLERSKQFTILKELTFIDELTGLYNRRFLNTLLEKEIKKIERYGGFFTFVLADMNNFKKINDLYGHLKGDEVLKKVADIIKKRLRSSDISARYGGDEFAIILFETKEENAIKVMEDINNELRNLDLGLDINISLSYGTSTFPENSKDFKTLIELADNNLYVKKNPQRFDK